MIGNAGRSHRREDDGQLPRTRSGTTLDLPPGGQYHGPSIDGQPDDVETIAGRALLGAKRLNGDAPHTTDLTKSYGGRTVVRGVDLEIASGEVVGLLGPNGAGKTTTFSMVVGLTAPGLGARAARRRGRHRRPDVRPRAQGDRLPAAGGLDLPRPHGRAEHHRDPRDARPRWRRDAARGCASCWPSSG